MNWKRLFLQARSMIEDEDRRHDAGCGCQDVYDPVVEGPCPGVKERKKFLKRTEQLVEPESRDASVKEGP